MLEAETRRRVERFLRALRDEGLTFKVVSGYRTWEQQDELYRQGRDKPGRVVTYVRGGGSAHNYGRAVDIAQVVNGELVWEWDFERVGKIGEQCGLEWPYRKWGFDEGHFQWLGGRTIRQLKHARLQKLAHEAGDGQR